MKIEVLLLMIAHAFASEQTKNEAESTAKSLENIKEKLTENPILVKIEEDECAKGKTASDFIGVTYNMYEGRTPKWRAQRWNKSEKKKYYNGYYDDEKTAARASDTLARTLMKRSDQNLKLNFPDDETEVHKKTLEPTSLYFGVNYNSKISKWYAQRRSKEGKNTVSNGCYNDEEKRLTRVTLWQGN
jgi:hypothetical protein